MSPVADLAPARGWQLTLDGLFGGFGVLACLLLFVGVLKSLPGVARAPIDITPVLFGLTALHLAFALACRRYVLAPAVPVLFGLHAALALLAVLSAGVSQGREIFPDKLRDLVLVAPAMLTIGVAVAADPRAFRRFLLAAKVIGPLMGAFIAAAFSLGLVDVVIQFGGRGSVATQRVQYQITNLLLALAASSYAVAVLRTRGVLRLANVAMAMLVAIAALIPGGRAGFVGLVLATILAPCLVLWHRGQRARAAGVLLLLAGLGTMAVAVLLASSQLASGLRTVERFTQGGIGESSARLPLWRAAFALIAQNGPFGVGFGAYTPSAGWGTARGLYPHNVFIEALVELGLAGFVLYVGIWATAGLGWLAAGRRAGAEQWAASAALGLIMLIMISVSTNLGNPLPWFALGVLAGSGVGSASRWPPAPVP